MQVCSLFWELKILYALWCSQRNNSNTKNVCFVKLGTELCRPYGRGQRSSEFTTTNIGFEVLRPQKHVGHHCDYNGCGGEGWGERVVQGFEMDRYTVLYLKWITNKGLLYSTDNCSMLCGCLDGSRVWGRMDTCICMAESLHCSPETLTTLLIGYLLLFSPSVMSNAL